MRRILILAASVWLTVAAAHAQSAGKTLALDPGARIGVLYLLAPDLTHYHVGFTIFGNHWKQYAVGWPIRQRVERQLQDGIAARGYAPVVVAPSDDVLTSRVRTFGDATFASPGLSNAALEEYLRIAAEQDLAALVVMAPTLDNSVSTAGSIWVSEVWTFPDSISDWGVSTTSKSGRTKPIVFNKSNLMLLDMRGARPKAIKHVWGDNDTMKWRKYEWPEDMKELPPGSFEGAGPILEQMLDRQITTLLEALQPAAAP